MIVSMIAINAKRRADQLAASLRDANEQLGALLEREKEFSILLQRALLPEDPSVDAGYAVAFGYVPAYTGTEVGGDFYDVFSAGFGKTGILIGDVSGKGLQAASVAATARSTIHAFLHETPSAGAALDRTNSVLCNLTEQFVTAFLIALDPANGQISYSSAGHPPAAILRSDGHVGLLELGGMPLAIQDSERYAELTDHLDTGDKIVLFTDGISESRRDGDLLGLDGIERVLSGHGNWDADEVVSNLLAAASDWAYDGLSDDAAVVVVERKILV